MGLRASDDTLLSLLEYGADPKEMEPSDDGGAYAGRRGTDDSASLVSALSRQPGQEPAAGLPLELTAASAEKEGRRLSSLASPARSERQRLIPAWKPTDEARQGSRSGGPSGPTPRPGGSAQKPRAAWGAGPAAQPPPPGLRPSRQPLRGPVPSPSANQQGDRAHMLAVIAAQPKQFPCSLDPIPASSSDASAGAGNPATRKAGMAQSVVAARPSSNMEGRGAQLVRAPSGGSRWGLTSAPAGALDVGAAQARVRMKNRVIADLRSQKQQLTEELEAALVENQQLKQRVQQGDHLKAQHDGLLERLRGARAELDQVLAQRQQADMAMGSLQQRVRAMAAKQAVSREMEHKMATRMTEKNHMLDQLYNTLKELKQQYEASREEAAKAAAGLDEAQRRAAQHEAAIEEARKLQAGASAALVSLGLRCEGLAETLAAESGARQVAETALKSKEQDLLAAEGELQAARQELQDRDRQLGNLAADLSGARQRVEGLEQELHSAWDAAQAQRQRTAALQEDLQSAWADAQEQRRAAAAAVQEADALRAKVAELPESDEELEGSDLDVALPAFMGESRAQLIRSREFVQGQLTAEMEADEEGTAPVNISAEDAGHMERPHPIMEVGHSPNESQDGVVQSAKEAFEAMSASGGWSVYTNKVARRISDGGTSSTLAHETSL